MYVPLEGGHMGPPLQSRRLFMVISLMGRCSGPVGAQASPAPATYTQMQSKAIEYSCHSERSAAE